MKKALIIITIILILGILGACLPDYQGSNNKSINNPENTTERTTEITTETTTETTENTNNTTTAWNEKFHINNDYIYNN